MKLYKVTGELPDRTIKGVWLGTQAGANRQRAEMKREGLALIEIETIDVPTNKDGLLTWLNENGV